MEKGEERPANMETPQQRLQAFGQELSALCQKYGVQIRPFIKSYNGGQQIADVEFVVVNNGNSPSSV